MIEGRAVIIPGDDIDTDVPRARREEGSATSVGYQRPSRIRPWNSHVSVQGSKV